ncbi:zf-U1 domain-containing protein [Rhizoctonia solani AG-1 IA]|uniref:Zf-U1 domain-containing protein n=1 Tax=Thanatephorus cucumeris (strain AG1-IA) TaxID=983506 RepID=L8WCD6_THACA|nr:zf-U1 domain-containing protein [Rhizoctonia solani AG-1 IA]
MPKHYCDYCDVFLTHDSTSGMKYIHVLLGLISNRIHLVRKAHNSGRNHLANVQDYYASLGHDKAQNIIDQITSAYESGGGPPRGGFNFGPNAFAPPPPNFGGPGFGPPPMGFGGRGM